jgi:ABC-type multidrug transport system permease subunit
MSKNKIRYLVLTLSIFLIGIVIPFIPALHMFEIFILSMPILICFSMCLLLLPVALISKNKKGIKFLSLFLSLILLFISSQLLSGYTVEKYQKYRCNKLIKELDTFKNTNDYYPENLKKSIIGIEYSLLEKDEYELAFECGFFVTEKFNSKQDKWERRGFND